MPQRPRAPFQIHRRPQPPEIPAAADLGGNTAPSDSPHVVWRDPADADRAETAPAPGAPTGGESLPDTSGGRVCPKCWAYAIDPAGHAEWHAKFDRWAAGVNRDLSAIQRILQQRGHIPTADDTTTDGNTADA